MKYKFIDTLTSDVLFEAYGKDLKELFENAALALASVICKIDEVQEKEFAEYQFKADNAEELMLNWLQGIIAVVDTEQKFFSKFEIKEIDENHLIVKCSGESMRPELGETVVKAVTYYKYKFEQTDKGYKVTVSLDI